MVLNVNLRCRSLTVYNNLTNRSTLVYAVRSDESPFLLDIVTLYVQMPYTLVSAYNIIVLRLYINIENSQPKEIKHNHNYFKSYNCYS